MENYILCFPTGLITFDVPCISPFWLFSFTFVIVASSTVLETDF